jgi:glycine cleavage system H lipoate-binding protein
MANPDAGEVTFGKIAKGILLFPFVVLYGLLVLVVMQLVFLPLFSLFQLVRFGVDGRFRRRILDAPPGALAAFFHPRHVWALPEGPEVMVGPDDFTTSLVGAKVDRIEPAGVGDEIAEGGKIWGIQLGDRSLNQILPVNGTVIEVNGKLLEDPRRLATAPLRDRWIVKVRPAGGLEALKNRLTYSTFQTWNEQVKDRMFSRFQAKFGPSYADGGKLIPDLASILTDQEWKDLVASEFE